MQARLKTLGRVPPEHQPLLASAEEYLRLRDESWRLRAAALHKSSMPALRKAETAERASLQAFERLKPAEPAARKWPRSSAHAAGPAHHGLSGLVLTGGSKDRLSASTINVSPISLASLTFACAFGGALLGSYIRSLPPAGAPEQRVAGRHAARHGAGGDDDGAAPRPRDGFRAQHVRQPGRRDPRRARRTSSRSIGCSPGTARKRSPPGTSFDRRVAFRIETTWPDDGSRGTGSDAEPCRAGARGNREPDPRADARQRRPALVQDGVAQAERRGLEGALADSRQPGRDGSDRVPGRRDLVADGDVRELRPLRPAERLGHRGPLRRRALGRGRGLPDSRARRPVRRADQNLERPASLCARHLGQ